MNDARRPSPVRTRREPPRFRRVEVRGVEARTPRLLRVTLAGPELEGLQVDEPAASVRLLLPPPGEGELVMPEWSGNEFRLPDGSRPLIRTLTPLATSAADPDEPRLAVDVVVHDSGALSDWAGQAAPGAPAAVAGPGRGYTVDPDAPAYLLGGDETALPAIGQLLDVLPADIPVDVHIEVARSDARLDLPDHPRAAVTWHDLADGAAPGDALAAAIRHAAPSSGTRVWVAGEAAGVQKIRRHLFQELGLPRAEVTVRGYWKHGRAGDGD